MKRLIPFFLFALSCHAQTYVNSHNGTGFPLSISSGGSTGSGHLIIVVADAGTSPTSITLTGGGNQSMTQVCTIAGANCSIFSNSLSKLSVWIVANSNSGQTSVTQSGAASVNAVYEYEYSGMITTNSVFDWLAFCQTTTFQCIARYTPSTANEVVVAAENCQGSGSGLAGSSWTHTSNPSGEGGGVLTTSSIGLLTMGPDSGCYSSSQMGGIIAGFRASGGTGTTCSWTPTEIAVSTQSSGTNPTTSVTMNVHLTGDLVVATGWTLNGSPGTVTLGSQTATQTSQSGTPSSTSGNPALYYVLSASATGNQTLQVTSSGGATEGQVSGTEFTPNPGCTNNTHDGTDPSAGSGSTIAINAPSITSTSGDLQFVFSASAVHVSTVNSPWSCLEFANEVAPCTYTTTANADGYILSSSSSSTANNMTGNSAGDWQALITSFKTAQPGGVMRHRALVIQQ